MKTVTISIFLFLSVSNFAQKEPNLIWSNVYQTPQIGYLNQKFLGSNSKSIYILDVIGVKNYILLEYDYRLQLVNKTPINFKHKGEKVSIKQILKIKGKNYLIGITENRKKNLNTILYFDMKNSKLIAEKFKILDTYEYDNNMFFTTDSEEDEDINGFSVSQDSSLLVFGSSIRKKERSKRKESYQFAVYNENMKLQYKKKVFFDFKDNDIDIKDFKVNNLGDILITAIVDKRVRVFKLSKEEELSELSFYPEGTYSESAFLFHTVSDDFYITGYCTKSLSKKEKGKNISINFFISKFNKDGKPYFEKIISLKGDKYINDKRGNPKSRKERNHSLMKVNNILVNYDDQTISVAAEYTKGSIKSGYLTTSEITLTTLSFEGDYLWSTDVSKYSNQELFGFRNLSYTFGYDKNGGVILLYNDFKTAKERKELVGRSTRKYSKMFVDATYINKAGEKEDQRTIYISKSKYFFDSYMSKKVGNDALLIYCKNNSRMKLGLLTYPLP